MPKPTLAQLADYFTQSPTFKGIDAKAAAEELYARLFPKNDEIYVLVGKNEEGEVEIATATFNATEGDKLRSKFIGLAGRFVKVDKHLDELHLTPYYVELDPTGENGFTVEAKSYVEPVYTNDGGMYGTVFGIDENDALAKAKILLEENYRDLDDIE